MILSCVRTISYLFVLFHRDAFLLQPVFVTTGKGFREVSSCENIIIIIIIIIISVRLGGEVEFLFSITCAFFSVRTRSAAAVPPRHGSKNPDRQSLLSYVHFFVPLFCFSFPDPADVFLSYPSFTSSYFCCCFRCFLGFGQQFFSSDTACSRLNAFSSRLSIRAVRAYRVVEFGIHLRWINRQDRRNGIIEAA